MSDYPATGEEAAELFDRVVANLPAAERPKLLRRWLPQLHVAMWGKQIRDLAFAHGVEHQKASPREVTRDWTIAHYWFIEGGYRTFRDLAKALRRSPNREKFRKASRRTGRQVYLTADDLDKIITRLRKRAKKHGITLKAGMSSRDLKLACSGPAYHEYPAPWDSGETISWDGVIELPPV